MSEMVTECWEFRVPSEQFHLVSAPMSDVEDFNRPQLQDAIRKLRKVHINAFNPFAFTANDLSKKESSFFLSRYLPAVTHERCVGLILLDGWETSDGACTEVLLAKRFSKPLFKYSETPENVYTIPFETEVPQ